MTSLSHNNYDVIDIFCGVFLRVYFGPKGSVRLDQKMACDVIVYLTLRHKTMTSPLVKFSSLTEANAKSDKYFFTVGPSKLEVFTFFIS